MKKLMFLVSISLLIISCKKYEEGPMFSLRTKEERLANTWKVKQYLENGVDKTNDFNNVFNGYVMTISKNGNYTLTYKAFGLVNSSESGTWYFNADKTSVTFKNNNNTTTWEILKLMEKELWARYTDDDDNIEIRLIPL